MCRVTSAPRHRPLESCYVPAVFDQTFARCEYILFTTNKPRSAGIPDSDLDLAVSTIRHDFSLYTSHLWIVTVGKPLSLLHRFKSPAVAGLTHNNLTSLSHHAGIHTGATPSKCRLYLYLLKAEYWQGHSKYHAPKIRGTKAPPTDSV